MQPVAPAPNSAVVADLHLTISAHPSELCVLVLTVRNLSGPTTAEHGDLARALLELRGKGWRVKVADGGASASMKFLYLDGDAKCPFPSFADHAGELHPARALLSMLAGAARGGQTTPYP